MNDDTHIATYTKTPIKHTGPKKVSRSTQYLPMTMCGVELTDGMRYIGEVDIDNPRAAKATCMGCILVRFQDQALAETT